MDLEDDSGDPFAIPDLWKPASQTWNDTDTPTVLLPSLDLDVSLGSLPDLKPPTIPESLSCDLDNFSWGPLPQLEPLDEYSGSSEADFELKDAEETDDIWRDTCTLESAPAVVKYSWEELNDDIPEEPCSAYLSEAGPRVYDAVLELVAERGVDRKVVQTSALVSSLYELGLGRGSVLFKYDEKKGGFSSILCSFRLPGIHTLTTRSLCERLLDCGNQTRFLQTWIHATYASRRSTPGVIALAEAVSVVLSTIEAKLGATRPSTQTIIQLQALFHHPRMIVTCIKDLIAAASSAADDEQLLSLLYDKVQHLEHRTGWLGDLLLEMLSRVSAPWLDSVAGWIGVRGDASAFPDSPSRRRSFVRTEERTWIDELGAERKAADLTLDLSMIPAFLPEEEAKAIFETGKSLILLRTHHPEHPLARPGRSQGSDRPSLRWKHSWEDVERVESRCKEYERSLIATVKKHSQSGRLPLASTPANDAQLAIELRDEAWTHTPADDMAIARPLDDLLGHSQDDLRNLILDICAPETSRSPLASSTFAPPVQLSALLSFCPVISTQSRLINTACMRMLFKEHNLRSHLSVQRRFHLFGDGIFATCLSHALFDPELESAERKQGVARSGGTMGLKLGSRESWPPASSELRLALMGVLADTYSQNRDGSAEPRRPGGRPRVDELSGGLSFAVREMSPEELEKCVDPDAIEAMDFLRLQYKPPAPLDTIITPTSLFKYDRLFKLLLRIIRMMYVVNQLFTDSLDRRSRRRTANSTVEQKFRIEAHHFVSTICDYYLHVGVGATWQRFEDKLDEVEGRIDQEDRDGAVGLTDSIERLREYHERVLDRMMFATLLRKRQEPVLKLLEDIFGAVLAFAKYSREREQGRDGAPDEPVKQLHARFKKKLTVFIGVCRGLSEKRGYGEKRTTGMGESDRGLFGAEDMSEEGGNTIGLLLLRLDMSGYYSG